MRIAAPGAVILAAGCGGETEGNANAPKQDSGTATDSGTTSDSGNDALVDVSVDYPALPVPDGGYPFCTGGSDGGFFGPCCQTVRCYDPPGGVCPDATQVTHSDLGFSSLGSGTCACGSINGPFDHDSAAPYAETPGACCYTVSTQGCMGRPLLVAGEMRLAPLVRGSAWI